MKKEELLQVLDEWNMWKRDSKAGIRRKEYMNKIYPFMERKEVIVLKGVRRAGKSTIMKQLMHELLKEGAKKEQILYLNLEDYRLKEYYSLGLFEEVYHIYLESLKNKNKTYFFIDEIQFIAGWERWIMTKYDQGANIKFIITGSNASLLSKELSTLLTGRNITFQINPLSFAEFMVFKGAKKPTKPLLDDYLDYGGFPEVVLEKDQMKKRLLLQQYFDDIINKDIISRYSIRNTELITSLAKYLLENSGQKTSFNNLAKVFGVSDDTIAAYIGYMVDAYLIIKVYFFSYSLKKKHNKKSLPKYYSMDNGLIYANSLNFSKNTGKKYENSVLLKLYQAYGEVSYWGNGSEVDFVTKDMAINVTSADHIPEREYIGLKDFQKKFKGFSGLIITDSKKGDSKIPLMDFLKD